jgi:hypothetical protein
MKNFKLIFLRKYFVGVTNVNCDEEDSVLGDEEDQEKQGEGGRQKREAVLRESVLGDEEEQEHQG